MDGPPTSRIDRVVVVGAGFAGLEAAKRLGRAGISCVVVDRRNHHLFQPLLYQVATAALSATDVAEPIRKILRRYPSVHVVYGEVVDLDMSSRQVALAGGDLLAFDHLLLAPGARTGYFGHERWRRLAPGLKSVEDARRIRSRLLLSFEHAERTPDEAERQRRLTFVVIGAGPTGVELAGSIAELSRHALARDFRNIRPESATVILLEGGSRILPGFSPKLSDYAHRKLERLGVCVNIATMVSDISEDGVEAGGRRIPAGMVIWAAGVQASPLGERLGVRTDGLGRVPVEPTLEVRGLPGVYVLGDLARVAGRDGVPLPGLAQVAKQQGRHLGDALAAHILHGADIPPFAYRSRGDTSIIGRHAAVFELDWFQVRGWPAWLAWAIVHIVLLVGFQNRLTVSVQWLWRYLTYERGARLIADEVTDMAAVRHSSRNLRTRPGIEGDGGKE